MSLTADHQKLLFDHTIASAEPRLGNGEPPRRFVVQMHDATRLHYDFRLEHAGVFKSWAIHKGPCLDAVECRFAKRVPDHQIQDGVYEGTIPAGVYGAGTILLWDCGHWLSDQDVDQALRAGQLKFRLDGHKLKGSWSLTRSDEKLLNWLLKKELDTEARSLSEMDILIDQPLSVRSGRALAEVALDPPPFVPAKLGTKRGRKPASNQRSLFPDDFEP